MSPDEKLEKMIASFQQLSPDKETMFKWYAAVERKRRKKRTFIQISVAAAAGIAIGVLCASLAFKSFTGSHEEEYFDATYASISVKNLE